MKIFLVHLETKGVKQDAPLTIKFGPFVPFHTHTQTNTHKHKSRLNNDNISTIVDDVDNNNNN